LELDLHLHGQDLPWKSAMFRIHRSENGEVVFAISGRLDAEHIAELETLIVAETKGRRILLDLKDMTLTGQDGIDFLTRCEAAGITLVNCDPYVREWITGEGSGK
jgi:anti-anti-sigma regulatory factor